MKCPLLLIERTYRAEPGKRNIGNCIKEACAWWDVAFDTCGFLSMEADLKAISNFLDEICQKMPHEKQFRKKGGRQ